MWKAVAFNILVLSAPYLPRCFHFFSTTSLISDLDLADDAVIFAEMLDILMGALKLVNEESESLGLWVSWVKTTIQVFNYILDAAVLSGPVCDKDVQVTETFTYLGSDIHLTACCEPEVDRRLGRAGVMDSLDHGAWCCWYLCRRMKV